MRRGVNRISLYNISAHQSETNNVSVSTIAPYHTGITVLGRHFNCNFEYSVIICKTSATKNFRWLMTTFS